MITSMLLTHGSDYIKYLSLPLTVAEMRDNTKAIADHVQPTIVSSKSLGSLPPWPGDPKSIVLTNQRTPIQNANPRGPKFRYVYPHLDARSSVAVMGPPGNFLWLDKSGCNLEARTAES